MIDRMGTVRRNIVLPEALDKELEAVAEMLKENKSTLVTRAVSFYLDHLDLAIAKERARRYENGARASRDATEIKETLGL